MKKKHVGSTLESLLEKDGTREDVYAEAVKRVIALQLREAMKRTGTSVSEMARRMTTSRSQVERVIGPQPETMTVATLAKAARAVGYRLDIKLIPARSTHPRAGRAAHG
jgi:transcriptional regulator with XRE-family HTH domain